MMLATLLTAATASPVPATWDLEVGTRHRWLTETEVRFPGHVWLYADRNVDVRAHTLALQLVVDCEVAESRARDGASLACTLTDVAVGGGGFPGDEERLPTVMREFDAKLTNAPVQLVLGERGKVRSIEVETNSLVRSDNRRIRTQDEFLRMMVVRALAPLDLELPEAGIPLDDDFRAASELTLSTPVTRGSAGEARIRHTAEVLDGEQVRIRSAGSGTLVPGGDFDRSGFTMKARFEGETVFDTANGRVSEALWFTSGTPTAVQGPLGRGYSSVTLLRSLADDENPQLTGPFTDLPGS